MKRTKLIKKSNWETVAFLLINKILGRRNFPFERPGLMSAANLQAAVIFLMLLGHKENPTHPEQSLQSTIQKMRDKGYIEFCDGRGKYKLTEVGYNEMCAVIERHRDILNKLDDDLGEYLQL
ncbi:MAG: hypothetical protein M0Z48_10335 [Nitrospiraceae bacterium]|nr:hypothetical protein [Nitrospiraceae bacterium]